LQKKLVIVSIPVTVVAAVAKL